jgi:hypothetical protein
VIGRGHRNAAMLLDGLTMDEANKPQFARVFLTDPSAARSRAGQRQSFPQNIHIPFN